MLFAIGKKPLASSIDNLIVNLPVLYNNLQINKIVSTFTVWSAHGMELLSNLVFQPHAWHWPRFWQTKGRKNFGRLSGENHVGVIGIPYFVVAYFQWQGQL